MIELRRFREQDAETVSALIATTLRTTNIRDYSSEHIENDVKQLQPKHILERAGWMHFYVACEGETIVGCGAIGPYWGREDESSLFTIFVLPDHQGQGIGRRIVETLERDEYFLRARPSGIPVAITGTRLYRRMGYDYKNGLRVPDAEGLLRLEKIRELN